MSCTVTTGLHSLYPVAMVTNYHAFGNLKQQKLILSRFWRPEVWSQAFSKPTLLLKALPGPWGCQHSSAAAHSQSLPQPCSGLSPFSICVFSFVQGSLPLDLGSVWDIQDDLTTGSLYLITFKLHS